VALGLGDRFKRLLRKFGNSLELAVVWLVLRFAKWVQLFKELQFEYLGCLFVFIELLSKSTIHNLKISFLVYILTGVSITGLRITETLSF
jgi:hypothetical protein